MAGVGLFVLPKNVEISLEKSMGCKPLRRVGRCPRMLHGISLSSGPRSAARGRSFGLCKAKALPGAVRAQRSGRMERKAPVKDRSLRLTIE